jgi:hypothetical protein
MNGNPQGDMRDVLGQNDDLDRALLEARPVRPTSAHLDAELKALVAATRPASRGTGAPHKRATIATLAVLGFAVFGGVGVAAAATVDSWAWWETGSDRILSYTLPTGAECEHHLGRVESADEELTAAAREILATADFEAMINLEAEYDRVLTDATRYASDPSAQVGDAYTIPSPEELYQTAMFQGIHESLTAELEERGFDRVRQGNAQISLSGHTECRPGE